MKRTIILFIYTLFILVQCFAQNDTLFLKGDHINLNGIKYNSYSKKGIKDGKWLNYEICKYESVDVCASGFDRETGMDAHWYSDISFEYRALMDGEKEGNHIVTKEETDTINGSIYTGLDIIEVRSKIPPDIFLITNIGFYKNDKKNGKWEYFYGNGEKMKTIYYNNGIPIRSFNIYRQDGSIMMLVEKVGGSMWKVSKLSNVGEIFKVKISNLDDFTALY